LAVYHDGTTAAVGDRVMGKPNYYHEDVVGEIVAIDQTKGDDVENAVVAFIEDVDLDLFSTSKSRRLLIQHWRGLNVLKPFVNSPVRALLLRAESCMTKLFQKLQGPPNVIVVNDEQHNVSGHVLTGAQIKQLAGRPSTERVFRRSGGGNDPEVGHDQTTEIRTGYDFYVAQQPESQA
jgi:Multiubiquitin